MNQNITIYRPKRKYNKPRYAMEIPAGEVRNFTDANIQVQVVNNSNKTVYLRKGKP